MAFQGPQGSGRRKVRPVEEAEVVGQLVEFLGQLGPLGQGKLLSRSRRRSWDRDGGRSSDRTQDWSIRARPRFRAHTAAG